VVNAVRTFAKSTNRVLEEAEIRAVIAGVGAGAAS
jgi:hypothetical protein